MNKCWICNEDTDSGEHKIKRTDLVRVFGEDEPFRSAGLRYLKHDGSKAVLQGPNSKHVKFKRVLCSKCNNETTQPFDRAYDAFIQYVEGDRESILQKRQIDFSRIYGDTWEESQLQLFRYFAKAFGCRIADAGKEVPTDIKTLLFAAPFQTALWVCLAIDEDELLRPEGGQTLRIGNIITNIPNLTFAKYATAYWYKWLMITFWYGWGPYGPAGGRWCADSQFIHLGSYSKSAAKPITIGEKKVQWPRF
jgi:hypothetical protein